MAGTISQRACIPRNRVHHEYPHVSLQDEVLGGMAQSP